ncbi:MAG: methylenetetrahydrofolate reductase [Candidatus Binataceae bacterium]
MPSLAESLAAPRPALWLEVSPPRGANPNLLIRRLEAFVGHADAINLTDNALGRVKMSGLVFASFVKPRLGLPVVLNFSCRHRNRFALKSDLLGAAAIGIDGVVVLAGDPVAQDDPNSASAVRDMTPFGLLEMIAALNRGDTGEAKPALKTLPSLYAGAVANPNSANPDREIALLERKARAGAKFVITQPVFEAETARRFLAHTNRLSLRAMLGILPVKRASMATHIKEKVTDLSGASGHFDRYAGMTEDEARAFSIHENLELMKSLAGEVAGFNIMSGGGTSLAIELALEFSKWRKHANR